MRLPKIFSDMRGQVGGWAIGIVSSAIMLIVGLLVIYHVNAAMPTLTSGSAADNALTTVMSNTYTALTLLAVGLIIAAAMAIVALVVVRVRR